MARITRKTSFKVTALVLAYLVAFQPVAPEVHAVARLGAVHGWIYPQAPPVFGIGQKVGIPLVPDVALHPFLWGRGLAGGVHGLLPAIPGRQTIESYQASDNGQVVGPGETGAGTLASAADSDPRGFLVIDIQLDPQGGISLIWSDLGENFVYTVESCDSLAEQNWAPIAPVSQWPRALANWTDAAASGALTRFYRIKTEALYNPPPPPTDVRVTVSGGSLIITWSDVGGASSYNVYWSTNEKFTKLDANKIENVTSPYVHGDLAFGVTYYYVVTAVGDKGESELSAVASVTLAPPPVDGTVATTVAAATEFLYSGENPVQTGVAEGTIEPKRVGVLRGKVLTTEEQPLSGVTVTILDHPEYGQTQSREDGMYDMAVNGGGLLTLEYQKESYLPAQRQIDVPWQDYIWLPDVILIQRDANVTEVDFSEPVEAAQGSVVTDRDGTRQATVLFPEGTQAEIVLPDGSTQPVSTLNVRATEFSVGENGPKRMPAELPPNVMYTYCVELTADEVVAKVNGKDVVFSQPVYFYTDNFLDAAVGSNVPVGYYDDDRGVWVPSDNGRVIKILSITDGLADLDVNGDGSADSGTALSDLGINDAERQKLANLYQPDQSLWRMPIKHFSTWDANWGFGPPDDATPPNDGDPDDDDDIDDPCEGGSSIVEIQSQRLGERVSVVGTPFTLNYRSDPVPGNGAAYTLKIPLSGETVPASLIGIELEILIAGRKFTHSLSTGHICLPATLEYKAAGGRMAPLDDPIDLTNQSYRFVWDGKDCYGRTLQGKQPVTVRIGYVYCGVYQETSRFGYSAGKMITGSGTRQTVTLWKDWDGMIGPWHAGPQGLGAWSLSVHHAYDPQGKTLYLGNGDRRGAAGAAYGIIETVAGRPLPFEFGLHEVWDGFPATSGPLTVATGIAVGPDGSLYIATMNCVRRVRPDGIITTVAGKIGEESGFSGDGGPATQARLRIVDNSGYGGDVALGPDGSLYIADTYNNRIRMVDPDGIITTVAGNGVYEYGGDGGPASEAPLRWPFGVALGPDGSIYIADTANNRVRRVGPDGIITTVAGTGAGGYSGDGGPATQATVWEPLRVAVGPDGSIYIAESARWISGFESERVRRVGPDGIITTVAGTGAAGFSGDGGPATEAKLHLPHGVALGGDGAIYIADRLNSRVRRVGPDGIITTVVGTGKSGFGLDGGPPTMVSMEEPLDVGVGPDGNLYIVHNDPAWMTAWGRVRRVKPAFPAFTDVNIAVASEDGSELYQFDSAGRHLRTLNTLTGAVLYEFHYDSKGLLIEVKDGDDNITTIERDAEGNPTAIVGPYGQRTTLALNANGYLASIANPASETTSCTYTDDGLLATYTDPKGYASKFTYDELGRLIRDEDPAGGFLALSREEKENSYTVTATTATGRVTTYQVENLPTGDQRRVSSFCSGCGTQATTLIGTDGTQTVTLPDGTKVSTVLGPDPRFGMQSPIIASQTTTTPGGLESMSSTSRAATLRDPNDPLSLETLTDTVNVNGRAHTLVYDAASRRFTATSPEGRRSTAMIDDQGRMLELQVAGGDRLSFVYDAHGRRTSVTAGAETEARTTTLSYNNEGDLGTITDSLGRTFAFDYDAARRVTIQTLPDSRAVFRAYDANGNLTSICPPGRPAHGFDYTPLDFEATYTPPEVGAGTNVTRQAFNAERELTLIIRPDGKTIEFEYGGVDCGTGRLLSVTTPRGQIAYAYEPATGKLAAATAPDGGTVSFVHDGWLPTSATWGGMVGGTVGCAYNNDLLVMSRSIDGEDIVNFTYDKDGLLTQAGEISLTRGPETGLVTGSTLGNVTDTIGYNTLGEVQTYRAAYSGANVFAAEYHRDKWGRIIQKTETITGHTDVYAYTYDLAGRLTEVKKNDVTSATYAYDSNGNRLSYTGPGGTVNGTYDAQDRLLQYGSTTYTYTPNGELLAKTDTSTSETTNYEYDVLGNLMSVTLPDGRKIEYVIDGVNRRVGQRVNGTLVQGFLYKDQLEPVVELDGDGNVVACFIYASKHNVPDYMEKEGNTYRIISDHLGSPRIVIDTATGQIVQQIECDEFGSVLRDTNPGFQPFGFAGGIYDQDTKLVRFGARDYDPEAGRWTAKDPIRFASRDANLYAYALNDPVTFDDPTGLTTAEDVKEGLKHGPTEAACHLLPGPASLGCTVLTAPVNPCDQARGLDYVGTGGKRKKEAEEAGKQVPQVDANGRPITYQ